MNLFRTPIITGHSRSFWGGLFIGGAIVLLFQYSLLLNITKPLGPLHGDAYLVNFLLNHWMRGAGVDLAMFYGFSNSLFFTDHHLVQAIGALPLYLLTRDIITTSNLVAVATIVVSFVSMYCVMWAMTRQAAASILAGILFVLNPFIFARYPDQLILFSLQWIPLIFWSLERRRFGWTFVLLGMQLLTSLYYSVFLTVILPLYMVLRRIRPVWDRATIAGAAFFLTVTTVSAVAYARVFAKEPIRRSIDVVKTYAARPADWFTASEGNMVYGGLPKREDSIYSEHSLFPGMVAIALLAASFFALRRAPERGIWSAGIIIIFVSVILSFGPTIPGLYQVLYAINPLFPFIRTSARIAVFAYFFLAWIAGLTVARLAPKHHAGIIGVILVGLVLVEYWNKPLDFLTIDPSTRSLYQSLNERQDIRVLLEYPIGNLISYDYPQARAEDLDARYLLYATILHTKTLLNGYSGFLPAEYYRRANLLSVHFPTDEKLRLLRAWGVDAILLHRDEFRDPSLYEAVREGMLARRVPLIAERPTLALFDLTAWKEAP